MEPILKLEHIQKYYGNGGNITKAIKDISFSVEPGEFLGIMGASGSGKTTLLNCISTIDTVSAGHIYLEGTDITEIKPKSLARFRRENLGFVFQDFNLLDTLTISENIALALSINKTPAKDVEPRILDIAGTLHVKGKGISVGSGSLLRVERNGLVELNDGVVLGANSIVLCEQHISIGEQTILSWNCQFMDTDTHSIIDLESGDILSRSHPIIIGQHCWIGNHVLVNKGTVLPNDTIVASYSLCNKDYRNIIHENSIIGGIPAKKLTENKRRNNDKLR